MHALTAEDTLAIQAVVAKYGFLIDDRRWDEFDQLFTEDAVVDLRLEGSESSSPLGVYAGRDEIVRNYRQLSHPIQHMVVSHMIEDVDDGRAVVHSKALLPMPGNVIVDLVYRDVVVRTPTGWRIQHKSIRRYTNGAAPRDDTPDA